MRNGLVKEDVLKALEEHRGETVSGATLAGALGVSRTAVWKAVAELRAAGYPISAGTNRGYALLPGSRILSVPGIIAHLPPNLSRAAGGNPDISIHKTIDSTNNEAKRRIAASAPTTTPFGTVIIAEEQTAGRGRRGRDFHSPVADSLYISFILKPLCAIEQAQRITIAAAVAVCEAIEALSGTAPLGPGTEASISAHACKATEVLSGTEANPIPTTTLKSNLHPPQIPGIKWVNDILIEGKKICGILTEAVSDIESGMVESIILGIGININVPETDFPADIRESAGSLRLVPGERNRFAATLIATVHANCARLTEESLIADYRRRLIMLNKPVLVLKNGEKKNAHALDIDADGGLIVRYEDGGKEALRSGEVSIRPADR